MTATLSPNPEPQLDQRLVSLDALRGFDMFWIIGGSSIYLKLVLLVQKSAPPGGEHWFDWLQGQTVHVEWHGFSLRDLIFPLFLFIAGVALPFSYGKRLERGDSKLLLYRHALVRGVVLVVLGMIYNGLLQFHWEEMRYTSVLGRIGLAWMFAAFIVLNTNWRGQLLATVALLVGYWAALRYIPVPGFGAGDFQPGHTLTDYVDRLFLPGRPLHYKDPAVARDPEGILALFPSIATALIGALTGEFLRAKQYSGPRKALGLVVAGIACTAAAWLWNFSFPINKNLWSSSFVLLCAGLSLLQLALFYWIIDVLQFRRWAFFFVVIGYNSILIYLAGKLIDFDFTTQFLIGGIHSHTGTLGPVIYYITLVMIKWLLLYFLYRQRVSLRV